MSRPRTVAEERFLAAVRIAKQKKAVLNSRAAMAQAALESGWFRSDLCRKHNNLFGVKAGKGWAGPTVMLWTAEYDKTTKTYYRVPASWRVYPSWNEALVDYARLIAKLWWFKDALPFADPPHGDGDVLQWIAHLVDRDLPGELPWATGPRYVEKVMLCHQQLQG